MVLLSLLVQDQENNEAAIATGICPLTTGDKTSPKDIRSELEEGILSHIIYWALLNTAFLMTDKFLMVYKLCMYMYMYMCVLSTYCVLHGYTGQKRASNPMELDLVSHHVST